MKDLITDIGLYLEFKEYRKIGMTIEECFAALEYQLEQQINLYGAMNGKENRKRISASN